MGVDPHYWTFLYAGTLFRQCLAIFNTGTAFQRTGFSPRLKMSSSVVLIFLFQSWFALKCSIRSRCFEIPLSNERFEKGHRLRLFFRKKIVRWFLLVGNPLLHSVEIHAFVLCDTCDFT